ncbi:STY4851/ECs_5259 family protein [Methylotuvimicrobium sp. KM1]|uniref:STY4851/ECs_5259 family protein n=1 Tax=Methylotuvimicrobium sp. KM1 TaxID=3377707 RepID=UPI00384D1320
MEVSIQKVKNDSVFTFSSWLTAFLTRRSLKQPDQRPLYEYHVSNEEYVDLKRLLSECGNVANFTSDKTANACFTLFCAEWYRREYQRDCGWSWESIWSTLGFSFSAVELSRVVPNGLEGFWHRPIRYYESERRNFLGSLFSEGGLPFRLLKQSDSRFQTVFGKILKQYENAELLGQTTRQLVTGLIEQAGLPQVFMEDTSVDLIAQIADELVAIVHLYGLDTKDEPVNELDAASPNWRERFPIPLDEETGSEFLNGLLQSASKETRTRRGTDRQWNCTHFFTNQSSDALQSEISFPKEVTFNLDGDPPSCRLELAIFEAEEQLVSLGVGYAVLEEKRARVRLKHKLVRCKRQSPSDGLTLAALYGGSKLAEIPIQNTAVAVGEVPLGFEFVDDHWQLCGQASFKTKCVDVLLLLPNGSELNVDDGVYTDREQCLGCHTVNVQGTCVAMVLGEERFRIRIGDSASANLALDLKGHLLKWPCVPSLTFLGVPTVEWVNSEPDLGAKGAHIYLSGRPIDTCSLQQQLGRHYLSVRNNDNETLLRKRIGLLPADFKIELKSGQQSNQGSIHFYSKITCLYRLESSQVKARRVRHDDHTELSLEVEGIPPAHVKVLVTPNLESDPISIELPFPGSGYLAFDKDEKPLPKSLPVSDLLGARIYLFGRAEQSATNYRMELSLKGNSAAHAFYTWHAKVRDKPVEVNLFNLKDQVESLLSLQTGIDQAVELSIDSNIVCRIGRYAVGIDFGPSRRTLISSANNRKVPKPMLMLLSEPERHPIELHSRMSQGVATGEFELPAIIDRAGPWLIVPAKSSSVTFRPVFIPGNSNPSEPVSEIRNLQRAVLTFDPKSPVNAFEPVLNAMALNPAHSSWQFLKNLYDNYGYLPLSTFEVWRALVRIPAALAMAMFKFEMSVDFISRIETEFPFLWELFPIVEIRNAAERLKHDLLQKGVREEFVPELIKKMYDCFSEAVSSYNGNIKKWLNDGSIPQETQMPNAVMQHAVSTWYQELIRTRRDDSWPAFGGTRLKRWSLTQEESPISFEPEMDYRNAVVYLPVFAAAVAAGKSNFDDVFANSTDAVFFLRQVRDFDNQWFSDMYQYSLLRYTANNK